MTSLQKQKKEQASIRDEEIRRCLEKGISCDYGICDECPAINSSLQLRREKKERLIK